MYEDHDSFLKAKVIHLFHLRSTDVDRGVRVFAVRLSKIKNQLLGFANIDQQIVLCAPLCTNVNFLLV